MRLDPVYEVPDLLILLPLLFLAWGGFIAWRWYRTFQAASTFYALKRQQGELDSHVSEEDFRAGYIEAEAPRAATYAFAAALVCALLIPPGIAIFSQLWYEVWTLTGRYEPTATGTMIHTFGTFLFCVALMVAVLYVSMKRYYSNLPPRLSEVIRQLNGAVS
ncbi:MAG: hypothetical protein MRY64_03160 [Hyphomonadaceae bacterium]|nr:hypothetical protein [Hyphomonadaceae bacterium]